MSCTVVIKDKNLKPENIKMGITILKVTGTFEGGGGGEAVLEEKTVNSSTLSQEVLPGEGFDGLSKVTVEPYTLDSKTVNSSTSQQTVTSSADGLSSVTVEPYSLDSKTVDPSTSQQVVTSSVDGLSSVTVNPVTASIDPNLKADNIKEGENILGVTGVFAGTEVEPWYIRAKKGEITDVSAYSLDEFAAFYYGNAYLFVGTGITSCPKLTATELNSYNLLGTFKECRSFNASSKFEAEITKPGFYCFEDTFMGSNIKDVSISINANDSNYVFDETFSNASPGNVYIKANGIAESDENSNPISYGIKNASQMFIQFFNYGTADNVTIDVPVIVSSPQAFGSSFSSANCKNVTITTSKVLDSFNFFEYTFHYSKIDTLSIPNLSFIEGNNKFFYACADAKIDNLNVHPYVLSIYDNGEDGSKFAYNADIKNITLTAKATDNIYLDYCKNLSPEGVLNVLTNLDLSVSGKNVYFYSSGLTVADSGAYIKEAYNAATAAGWTIHNLTINVIDTVKFDEPVVSLDNSNTLNFNAVDSWTATVDNPSVTLSSNSGNAGSQSITVTTDSGWEGSAIATFTCRGVTNTVYLVKGNYTRLSYINVGGSAGQYCDTGVNLISESKVVLDYAITERTYSDGAGILSTNPNVNQWRVSPASDIDLRFTIGDYWIEAQHYGNSDRHNLEFVNFYVKDIDTNTIVINGGTAPFPSVDTLKLGVLDGAKIYELKLYLDGTNLSHDFIPVSIGTLIAFYDTVNNKYLVPNTGTLTGE